MGKLDGRVALVTGGGRGIGRAIALGFAGEGCTVAVSSRTLPELEAVAAEIDAAGGKGLAVKADAMSYEEIKASVQKVVAEFGTIHILANVAGGVLLAETPEGLSSVGHEDQAFIDNLSLNLISAQRACREVLPHMAKQQYGRIINIGSGYAKRGGGLISYTAAKHGIVGLTRAMATEVTELGITVNCLCPGWTNTLLSRWGFDLQGEGAEAARIAAASENIQNRLLEPEELAPMAVLLAAEHSYGITGQVISVDGGYRV